MARPPIVVFSLHYLLFPLLLLSLLTIVSLFIHTDVDIPLLASECYSHERSPLFKRYVPVLGTASCFFISVFQEALDSVRSLAIMAVMSAFVAGLATVCAVESARVCNRAGASVWSTKVIKNPAGPWLLFNLVGGCLVWMYLIVPAFMHRAKQVVLAGSGSRSRHTTGGGSGDAGTAAPDRDSGDHQNSPLSRDLIVAAELVAIPAAVAVGFILPTVLMLVFNSPVLILVWLFFPIYISLIQQAVRLAILKAAPEKSVKPLYLESYTPYLIVVYAIPILCSVAAHIFLIFNLVTSKDDRRDLTRSTLALIQIDITYLFLTMLYWIFVEVGLLPALTTILLSLLLGPGAGVSLVWAYFREHAIIAHWQYAANADADADDDGSSSSSSSSGSVAAHSEADAGENGRREADPSEQTPLLR